MSEQFTHHIEKSRAGVSNYLKQSLAAGKIDEVSCEAALKNATKNLEQWFADKCIDTLSPNLKGALARAIDEERWEDIVNAFRKDLSFGTAGIRGMMAFDRESVKRVKELGLDAPIIKGPNTINNIVLLRVSAGVAKFGKEQPKPFSKIVIGYDSRIRGFDFAAKVAELFLSYDYQVYLFDEPCPYPECNFAIPFHDIGADLGILISASHNDYRYNGYKLSCANSSQFDPEQRSRMYNEYIVPATTEAIKLLPLENAPADQLTILGGAAPLDRSELDGGRIVMESLYKKHRLINIHDRHRDHVKTFLMLKTLPAKEEPLKVGYCAFHGVGRKAVPRLLSEIGVREQDIKQIKVDGLNDLDGLFPSFCSDPGKEKQPDPGDPTAAKTEVGAFRKQYGDLDFDILIGTDPDADRCGVVVTVPQEQKALYGDDWTLLSADNLWTILLWFRLEMEAQAHGKIQNAEKKFVVLSNTTSDSITLLARKHGLGVVKTWVGFAALAAGVQDVWNERLGVPNNPRKLDVLQRIKDGHQPDAKDLCDSWVFEHFDMCNGQRAINVAAMEQSNGYSILGGPPKDDRSFGDGGHVRDKDGTLAGVLLTEVAAWAKANGTTILRLLDEKIFADPAIGVFANDYAQGPDDGEYPGIEGDRKKLDILKRAMGLSYRANAGDLRGTDAIAGLDVSKAVVHRTGKYDGNYQPSYSFKFPDEGVRFYFGNDLNYTTVRPSGTQNALRFHTQLHEPNPSGPIPEVRAKLRVKAALVTKELRKLLKGTD